MFPIRNQKRNCTDTDKIQHFLENAQTGFHAEQICARLL
jgi:uncharacterized protein